MSYKSSTIKLIAIALVLAALFGLCLPIQTVHAVSPTTILSIKQGETVVVMGEMFEEEKWYTEIPLFNQRDYPDVPYGNYGTVSSHGCGITCVAMAATYITGEYHGPDTLAYQFGNYNTAVGSYWILFEDSAEELGLGSVTQTYSWSKVKQALAEGKPVVSIQDVGLFTSGGHFILLTGINNDGKIMVNDPNGYNYTKNQELIDGFENGFDDNQITRDGSAYWIYEMDAPISNNENNELA